MQIKIEKLIYKGKGVGTLDCGRKVLVPYVAPGDIVEIKILKDLDTYCEAELVEIKTPSNLRVKPKCPVFGICGGCQWQHLSYEAQIKWKQEILIETFCRIGGTLDKKCDLSKIVFPTLKSPNEWHYRNRIQLHVNSKGQVGLYKPKSREVVEFKKCYIVEQWVNDELNKNRAIWSKRDKGISIRSSQKGSFSQINTLQNENIKKILKDWLKKIKHNNIAELYAGAGNFTFTLAESAKKIIGSDVDKHAIMYANALINSQPFENIEFYCESALKTLARFKKQSLDLLVLDPPRRGCIDIIDKILDTLPSSIFYISCDPATLARDLSVLCDKHYNLVFSQPVDMFPQTYHIESISFLSLV